MALWSSIRFSLRILRKHWKLTSIAVSSLAIAMAAGTAGFSVFNALLLRPPAVLRPDQLLTVYSSTPTEEFNGFCDDDYTFYRDHNEIFSDVMAFPYSISMSPVVHENRTKAGLTNAVSDTYFSILGVPPLLVSCLSWKWRERSSVKITERTTCEKSESTTLQRRRLP